MSRERFLEQFGIVAIEVRDLIRSIICNGLHYTLKRSLRLCAEETSRKGSHGINR